MSSADISQFEEVIRVNNKDFFVDLKSNDFGSYVKISERRGKNRNTVMVPVSGLEKLIEALNDAMDIVEGGAVIATARPTKTTTQVPGNPNSVFVSGFAKNATESDVVAFMSSKGRVVSVAMKGSGKFGSAMVEYSSPESAAQAVAELNETPYMDSIIRCRADKGSTVVVRSEAAAVPMVPNNPKKVKKVTVRDPDAPRVADELRVFCTNLSFDTTNEDLSAHFAGVGPIASAAVNMTRKGRSLGTAIVEFQNPASVAAAIAQLNGQELQGRDVTVREYYK